MIRKSIMAATAILACLSLCGPALASYVCDGTNDNLHVASAAVSGYPFTVAGWVKSTNDARFFMVGTNGSGDNYFLLQGSAGNFRVTVRTISNQNVNDGAFGDDAWYHVTAVFASSSDVRAYVNNAGEGSMNPAITPSAPNAMRFCEDLAGFNDFSGKIAHFAVWSIALDAGARSSLAGGTNPLSIAAADLVAYWPMTEDANDDKGAFHLTVTGATLDGADNPSVDPPRCLPCLMYYYQRRRAQ